MGGRAHCTPAISIDGSIGEHSLDSEMKAPYFNLEEILRRPIDLLEALLPWLGDRLHCEMPVGCVYSVYRVNAERGGRGPRGSLQLLDDAMNLRTVSIKRSSGYNKAIY